MLPTVNEARNLAALVPAVFAHAGPRPCTVLIVDDASTDDTEALVEDLRRRHGTVTLRRRDARLGLGSALREGLSLALADPRCSLIATLDADGSHDPAALPSLLDAAGAADFVQGSRYVRGGRILDWPWTRRATSRVVNALCRAAGSRLREHTTNYRVYSRAAAATAVATGGAAGYEWLVLASFGIQDAGLAVTEVPITFRDRTHGKSKLSAAVELRWAVTFTGLLARRLAARVARRAPRAAPALHRRDRNA